MLKVRLNLRSVVKTVACLAITTMFSSCDKDTDDKSIKVENGKIEQTVYAGNMTGENDVTFVTTGAWTSSISEGSTKAGTATWVFINPDHGNEAGTYTISISCELNTTGKDRTATITITCDDTDINIKITQKSTTEDGEPFDVTVIAAIVENGSELNSCEVIAFTDPYPGNNPNYGTYYYEGNEISRGYFKNGEFTIPLPNVFSGGSLYYITDLVLVEGATISNTSVRIVDAVLVAYNGQQSGEFIYSNQNRDIESILMFSWGETVITGSSSVTSEGIKYSVTYSNCTFKRGWNFMYMIITENTPTTVTATITTEEPNGMKWYFNEF